MASIEAEFTEERAMLIQRLMKSTNVHLVDKANHAFIWLCDVEVLRGMVRHAESGTPSASQVALSLRAGPHVVKQLKSWLARRTSKSDTDEAADVEPATPATPSTPTPATGESPQPSPTTPSKRKASKSESPSPTKIPRVTNPGLQRSKTAEDIAKARDNGRCVVTQMGEPVQICHIYPHSMGEKTGGERDEFWMLLQAFWPVNKIEQWKNDIFGPKGTEMPQNLLCLSNIVHDLWGKARLAFEPVEMAADGTSLTIRFWWLPGTKLHGRVALCVPPSLPASLKASPLNAKLWNCETDAPIYSGETIILTTTDPVAMPLPSFELLHMQWMLTRVAALCGAADVTDEDLEDEDLGDEDLEDEDFQSGGEMASPIPEALPPQA
ncbi:hypothetical protein BO83DRAFT_382289 [Aspergillus eucalypticola CBS 122712]|uniref:HNH nuclease domain-containing protein n=1 Tax=Aspergillus eucalypticola (strain CBS 122712 / IBT 29274) TaxID=1448314 RepID=A0A317UQX4_ASPEC|nr:uncharacterized protein BO83DRAFT_382289 [Aspergillus eucalypticola CBS 122712]PWY64005.1 hypothetical protein BO83DRAFT_382289 [Aspergillus eucalypticola CBS 122712]